MNLKFHSSHFSFWFLVTFGDKVTEVLRSLCLHFERQDGRDGKNQKENYATKVTKKQKMKVWDEQNNKGNVERID